MTRVEIAIEETDVENERGRLQPGIRATCSRCDHVVECFGRGGPSRRRAVMLFRDDCPTGEENFYVDPDADDGDRPVDPKPKPWWEK